MDFSYLSVVCAIKMAEDWHMKPKGKHYKTHTQAHTLTHLKGERNVTVEINDLIVTSSLRLF